MSLNILKCVWMAAHSCRESPIWLNGLTCIVSIDLVRSITPTFGSCYLNGTNPEQSSNLWTLLTSKRFIFTTINIIALLLLISSPAGPQDPRHCNLTHSKNTTKAWRLLKCLFKITVIYGCVIMLDQINCLEISLTCLLVCLYLFFVYSFVYLWVIHLLVYFV